MYKTLTRRQKEILDYIKTFYGAKGFAPSLEEIRDNFNLSAVSTVHEHLNNLKKKGFLKKDINQARSIEVVDPTLADNHFLEIQSLGIITAGKPIEAIEDPEPMYVNKELLDANGRYYALKVRGDSMIEDGIHDGDTIIIKEQNTAENGDTIIAVVQENLATLKRFYKEKKRIRLQPANSTMKPSYYREIEIRGKVVSLIRKF